MPATPPLTVQNGEDGLCLCLESLEKTGNAISLELAIELSLDLLLQALDRFSLRLHSHGTALCLISSGRNCQQNTMIQYLHSNMPKRAVIGTNGLLVSRDEQVAAHLGSLLENQYGCRLTVVPDCSSTLAAAENGGIDTFFIDERNEAGLEPERASLLQQLSSRSGPPIPLIALDDRNRIRERRKPCYHGWLGVPFDEREVYRLLCNELPTSLFADAKAELHEIHFNDFTYQTYSREFAETLKRLVTVGKHDVTILLAGETGTGKTTLARMVHNVSSRATHSFLTVACGALAANLIESELFGHVKGAFTGAETAKMGRFAAVGCGSLLLDEIDVLDAHQQAMLLRVIENGEYEQVGSHETRLFQARLIVATNEDLVTLMERNEFRSDLYYRLNVLEFRIPPLRDRPLDIVDLTLQFVDEFSQVHGVVIHRVRPDFLACLKSYQWPGNIRELKNHVRRAVLFCSNGELTVDDLAQDVAQAGREALAAPDSDTTSESLAGKMALSERELIEEALAANAQKRTTTAQALGISRVGLYKKMKRYGLL